MISFVYFDVGGVVIDDFSSNDKWQQLKTELGISVHKHTMFEKIWATYVSEINIDRDIETLLAILKKELGLQLPEDYRLLDGFVKRFTANPPIWPVIKKVKEKARIGLLTIMPPAKL